MTAVSFTPEEKLRVRNKTAISLLWVGILGIVMMFAGLTSGYIVRQEEGNWLVFELPTMFSIGTVFMILSSGSMYWATRSVKKSNSIGVKWGLGVTLFLGLAFCISQYIAWGQLVDMGVYFTGKSANASGSFLYVISGMHLVHLFAGVLSLIYTFARALNNSYDAQNNLGIRMCALYWHFLDILWVYLFLFLTYIR
ncbi:MAG: cytochrome c oxidase subunit 3 [Flavobacteriales bacterium]|nr:cytochrome c oxidase subunit 3 [Flavobacteriales bacterium]